MWPRVLFTMPLHIFLVFFISLGAMNFFISIMHIKKATRLRRIISGGESGRTRTSDWPWRQPRVQISIVIRFYFPILGGHFFPPTVFFVPFGILESRVNLQFHLTKNSIPNYTGN